MLSILIPAYNEANSILQTLDGLQKIMQTATTPYEIIVVDDGSKDDTARLAESVSGVRVVRQPTNGGYGRALKTGIRYATFDWIAIVDADSSYPLDRLTDLLTYIPRFDMVVGARTGVHYWGSWSKRISRIMLTRMVNFVIGQSIPDINSGFRIFRKDIAIKHSSRISSGFSFTTTLTLAMFLDEHFVVYVPIDYHQREGKSHVKMGRDTLRMMQILVMAILYYNPLKLFYLICFASVGLGLLVALLFLLIGSFSAGILFFAYSVLIAFIIGSLGFLAEAIRLSRLD